MVLIFGWVPFSFLMTAMPHNSLERHSLFYLLTHSQELLKPTNTGQLVKQFLEDTIIEPWSRVEPPEQLIEMLKSGQYTVRLVFPESFAIYQQVDEALNNQIAETKPRLYIVIDGTWQQARKIYRQSPYLHTIPLCQIESPQSSQYTLRRNQRDSGLCTAEVVAEIMRLEGDVNTAESLSESVRTFCESFHIRSDLSSGDAT